MHNNKKLAPTLIILTVIILAFVGGYFVAQKFKSSATGQAGATAPGAMPEMEVSVVSLKKQSVETFLELPARVLATKSSEVRPQVDGVILKRTFTEGQFVEKGTQLYQIDPTIYESSYHSALAVLSKAQANLKTVEAKSARYENLLTLEAVSRQEYDDQKALMIQARGDVLTAFAEVKRAKASLDYTRVLAPVSGFVGKSNILEGNLVTTNQTQPLTTITESSSVYIDMIEASKKIANVQDQLNIPVGVIVDGVESQELGTLTLIENFADTTNDSVRLRAEFENKNHKLISGMFVRAKLHLKPFDAILVPQRTATRAPDGGLIVYVVEKENVVKARPIKTDSTYQDNWIVADGLNEGDVIIYEGFQKIAEGMKVKPVLASTK